MLPSKLATVAFVAHDLFVFHGFPESFDEDVIAPAAFAIHADLDGVLFQYADESRTAELITLIRVNDLRPTIFQIWLDVTAVRSGRISPRLLREIRRTLF